MVWNAVKAAQMEYIRFCDARLPQSAEAVDHALIVVIAPLDELDAFPG